MMHCIFSRCLFCNNVAVFAPSLTLIDAWKGSKMVLSYALPVLGLILNTEHFPVEVLYPAQHSGLSLTT